jgi:polyisoprenoid-binding protein YceI
MSTTTWSIDASHSEVGFKVRHLMITNVKGSFGKYSATAAMEEDNLETAKITFEAEVASVNTGNEQRDGHLKSPEFFDVENHPSIKFESTKMEKAGENEYKLTGNLNVKGVEKSVVLDVTSLGIAKDPWGNTKAGFEVKGKINRNDFNLTWNAALETGGVLVSEEVNLIAEVQFLKQ